LRAVRNRGWVPVVGIACGLAILSKGPAGLIPLMVAATAVMILPDFGVIGMGGLLLILLESAVIAAPWYILQAISDFSLFWSTLVVHETILRVVSHLEDEPHGAGFTLRTFYAEIRYLWPLLMLVPPVAFANLRREIGEASRRIRPSTALWMLWLVVALGAACAVQTRLPWYILPALVPVALLSGAILADALTQSGPLRACRAALALVAIAIIASGVPRRWQNIAEYLQHQRDLSRPSYVMAVRAQQLGAAHGGGELFFAGIPLPTLVYYSGMLCHFVSADEKPYELISGNESSPVGIAFHDLVLVDPQGEAVTVSNLGQEWMLNGPDAGK
jgi:4-amino-4-deoxy-L-arabinose transferase-like glycosyltransferase